MHEDKADPYFGVCVTNDMDKRRFEYLLNVIGPKKLFNSVSKYNKQHSDSKPFVSTLLKWYGIQVPSACYAMKPMPNYHVYLLMLTNFVAFKVGVSGQWERRVLAFSRGHNLREFDLDHTVAVSFSDQHSARRAEQAVKCKLLPYKVVAPEFAPFGAYGHQEWRTAEAYPLAIAFLQEFESDPPRPWVAWRPPAPFQYAWEDEDCD